MSGDSSDEFWKADWDKLQTFSGKPCQLLIENPLFKIELLLHELEKFNYIPIRPSDTRIFNLYMLCSNDETYWFYWPLAPLYCDEMLWQSEKSLHLIWVG